MNTPYHLNGLHRILAERAIDKEAMLLDPVSVTPELNSGTVFGLPRCRKASRLVPNWTKLCEQADCRIRNQK